MTAKTGVVLGLGVVAGLIFLATWHPSASEILTEGDILASPNLLDLDSKYVWINQYLIKGRIDQLAYAKLYDAYLYRFYQLVGG